MTKKNSVKAQPTKEFFLYEITKDISLLDCIFDLLDNSIDGAERVLDSITPPKKNRYQGFKVEIEINESQFRIQDNCGGLKRKVAEDVAFNFGRSKTANSIAPHKSIGLYGIGLKRAIFKMGAKAEFRSRTSTDSYNVIMDVEKWKNDQSNDWTFPILDSKHDFKNGTEIVVTDIYDSIANQFRMENFLSKLKTAISRDYHFFIKEGFEILVNTKVITPYFYVFMESEDFKPTKYTFKDKISGVDVTIQAGMAAAPPEEDALLDPDIIVKDSDLYGWYVVCNDRVVLAANRDQKTIWKGQPDFTAWHSQYNGFIGFIFFKSSDPNELPWTTTKRDVDATSELFQRSLARMREATTPWIKYTTQRKSNKSQALKFESASKPVEIERVSKTSFAAPVMPTITGTAKNRQATISYSVTIDEKNKVAESLGNSSLSNREVGLETFKYYFEREVAE